jgi:glycosyltransferase involved in cell wall biosynthesis
LKERASQSALLTGHFVTNIPNPINTNLFKPRNKKDARMKLGLPIDKKLILFGSAKITDKRKGIDYFIESCKVLAQKYPELINELGVVVYGKESEVLKSLVPFPVYPLNYISNEKELVDVYNSVDIFVTPSLEENLPNTIMEAMACGVPCVGFNVGGIPEMIDHLHNGYVADYKSAEDFANGIHWALSESEYQSLSEEACRKVASSYSESAIAKRYIEIYNKIMGDND